MKKICFSILAILAMVGIASCGGGIQPANPSITYSPFNTGWYENYTDIPVRDCFEVEKVAATIVPDKDFPELHSCIKATVKVKTIKAVDLQGHRISSNCCIELLDKDEAVVDKSCWLSGEKDMFHSSEGDVTTLSGTIGDDWSHETAKEMLAKVKYIRLSGVGCGYE
ncbi:MAG: hypothetical protein K2H61_09925 [Muribaculaceae bacterium]|nr:hypothetical protein [Muribaculaceae bacterium]